MPQPLRPVRDEPAPLSVLSPESRGGAVASEGFGFQRNIALKYLPAWLSYDGFAGVVLEMTGDIEARFLSPGAGDAIWLVEVKDHPIEPAEFVEEVACFWKLHSGDCSTFRGFTLASACLSPRMRSFAVTLERVREALRVYPSGSVVTRQSLSDLDASADRLGLTPDRVRFILRWVRLDYGYPGASWEARSDFPSLVAQYLPAYASVSVAEHHAIAISLSDLLGSRLGTLISRREIELAMHRAVPQDHRPAPDPVTIHTSGSTDEPYGGRGIHLRWAEFFAGDHRRYPPEQDWERLVRQLVQTRDWLSAERDTRHLLVTGERRLSTAFAIGSVFSAVGGFRVDLDYRGSTWSTSSYADSSTPAYELRQEHVPGRGDELVVVLGIGLDVAEAVRSGLPSHGLAAAPLLLLHGEAPVTSPEQANLIVQQVKRAVRLELAATNTRQVSLFYAGPSSIALFAGHHWNAIAPAQLYEWTGRDYCRTCRLA